MSFQTKMQQRARNTCRRTNFSSSLSSLFRAKIDVWSFALSNSLISILEFALFLFLFCSQFLFRYFSSYIHIKSIIDKGKVLYFTYFLSFLSFSCFFYFLSFLYFPSFFIFFVFFIPSALLKILLFLFMISVFLINLNNNQ